MITPPALPAPASLPLPRAVPARPALAEGERLLPTLVATGLLVLLGDFLFWNQAPGVSLAIFIAALAAALVAGNWAVARTPRTGITLLLIAVSAWQTAMEISFANLAVVLALLAILVADLRYLHLPAGWARWSESFIAWAAAIGRWPWLVRAVQEQPLAAGQNLALGQKAGRLLAMIVPAAVLTVVFIAIFTAGNSIFQQFFHQALDRFSAMLTGFDFDVGRVFFWLFLATGCLAFIRPRDGAATPRPWAQPLGEWRRGDAGIAFWQSTIILAALNVLFFAVVTIDVIYLWQRAAPPAGIEPRSYLYDGIYSLITATVLSGVVLTFLFQQPAEVAGRRSLRVLAVVWIAQNCFLIAGVFLRLKLFLDVADMTEKRVYVACFLLLVTVGFALLCGHVLRGRLASQLIWRNVVATFCLFFILQFLNVPDWVARQNCARAAATGGAYGINVPYNMNLGPGSWPALIEFATRIPSGEVRNELVLDLRELALLQKIRLEALNWRGWQGRRDRNAAALVAWAAPFGELTAEERQSPAITRMRQTEQVLRRD